MLAILVENRLECTIGEAVMASGYEKSPDYDGPDVSWREVLVCFVALALLPWVLINVI